MRPIREVIAAACLLGLVVGSGVPGCDSKPRPGETAGPAVKTKPQEPSKPGVPEPAVVKKCAFPPALDGDLSDACWKTAKVAGVWVNVDTGRAAGHPSAAWVSYDVENLYVAFRNDEPDLAGILAEVTERDGNVWQDDSNEVFIDPTAGRKDYYQLIVNTRGALYDGCGRDGDWDSKADVAVKMTGERWSVELAVPLSDLGVVGSPRGQTWTANFCRNRRGEREVYAWSDTGADVHTPECFGKLRFE